MTGPPLNLPPAPDRLKSPSHSKLPIGPVLAVSFVAVVPIQAGSVTVNAGTLRIRSRAALGTGTVTLAGGSKMIQASEEGRYGFSNEQIATDSVLSGGIVEFPLAFGNDDKGLWLRNGTVSGPGAGGKWSIADSNR